MFSITRDGELARLSMEHGPVNAMDLEFCSGLLTRLDQLAADESRSVLLTGLDRAFSAGVDLKRWLCEGTDYVEPFLTALEATFERIFTFPKPLIAVIRGPAIAGGCMMATGCDYRLIGPQSRIGIPELRIGVPLPMLAIEIVRSVAAPAAFQRIVNVGAIYTGSHAVDVGLADEVVDDDQILRRGFEIAEEFMSVPLGAFQLTKRQVREPVVRRAEINRQRLGKEFIEMWKSPSTREAVERYVRDRLR